MQTLLAGMLLVCGLHNYGDAAVPSTIAVKGVELGMDYSAAIATLKSRGYFAKTEMSIFGLEMDSTFSACSFALYEADRILGLLDAPCEGLPCTGLIMASAAK